MPTTPDDYLALAPEALDLEIGRALMAGQLGAKPVPDAEARAAAARWFEANLARFRGAVCGHPVVQAQLLDKQAQGRNELFAAVADALGKMAGIPGLPILALAAKLLHYGLGQLCPAVTAPQP